MRTDRQKDRRTDRNNRANNHFCNFSKTSNMIILKSLEGIPESKLKGCSGLEVEEEE
jgi:hypothetical protein